MDKAFNEQPVSKEFCRQISECFEYGNTYVKEVICEDHWDFSNKGRSTCGMTRQEYSGIRNYTQFLYSCLNRSLYSGKGEKFNLLTSTINQALDRLPRYEGFVFRGTHLPKKVLKQHREGKIVNYPAFTSTSTTQMITDGFGHGGQNFLIYSTTGRPIMGINPDEKEVLFKTGTKFKILKAHSNYFIMREVTSDETKAEAKAEDARVMKLAMEASKLEKSKSRNAEGGDIWRCPVDPHNMPEVIHQQNQQSTKDFFQGKR